MAVILQQRRVLLHLGLAVCPREIEVSEKTKPKSNVENFEEKQECVCDECVGFAGRLFEVTHCFFLMLDGKTKTFSTCN